jgi:hypothetical protein
MSQFKKMQAGVQLIQGGQIGRIFAYCAVVFFGQFF